MLNDSMDLPEGLRVYLNQVIDNLPYLAYLVDKDCRLLMMNQNLLTYLKQPANLAYSKSLYQGFVEGKKWSQQRARTQKQRDINALVEHMVSLNMEEPPVVTDNGDIYYYLASRIPLFDENKKVTAMLVIMTDISHQKKLEHELATLKADAQQRSPQPEKMSAPLRNNNVPPLILMVEDSEMAQKATQTLLLNLDCNVDVAASEDSALSLFRPGKYDLIFMDIGLKDTSGYVVSKKIRQLEKNTAHHVPIIALTGFEAEIIQADCKDYFMEGAISKPLKLDQAQQLINHYIYHMDVPVRGLKGA